MTNAGPSVVQLKVTLLQVEPQIWRRLLVPGRVTLGTLHRILQAAMGWTDSHLHQFRVGDDVYGATDLEAPDEDLDDENAITLAEVAAASKSFFYDYDFGDGWEHEVLVEEVVDWPWAMKHAVCLAGERACPPEDVGGPPGYPEFLAALADPAHEEHEQWREWSGGGFDASWFSLVATNTALQYL